MKMLPFGHITPSQVPQQIAEAEDHPSDIATTRNRMDWLEAMIDEAMQRGDRPRASAMMKRYMLLSRYSYALTGQCISAVASMNIMDPITAPSQISTLQPHQ